MLHFLIELSNVYLPTEIPFEKTILNAINNNEIKKGSVKHAQEFLAKVNCIYASRYLVANKRIEARKWAKRVRSGQLKLRFKSCMVLILSFLPYSLIKFSGAKFGNIKPEFGENKAG